MVSIVRFAPLYIFLGLLPRSLWPLQLSTYSLLTYLLWSAVSPYLLHTPVVQSEAPCFSRVMLDEASLRGLQSPWASPGKVWHKPPFRSMNRSIKTTWDTTSRTRQNSSLPLLTGIQVGVENPCLYCLVLFHSLEVKI